MFTTIINDCKDDNARARQTSRTASLLGSNVSFVGVQSDLEAGVQLIDMLDATEGRRGLILVNVAPRGGHTTKWENGTPFAYFWYQETLVVTTVDGFTLSAVKKLNLTDTIYLLDTHTAAKTMLEHEFISAIAAAQIPDTQFRSFDFSPRVGAFLLHGHALPTTNYEMSNIPDLPAAIWHIDNFGNCKTTLTPADIDLTTDTETRFGKLPFIKQLCDVPDGESAITQGSSGIGNTRFLEFATQRKDFAKHHNVQIDDAIFSEESYFTTATT